MGQESRKISKQDFFVDQKKNPQLKMEMVEQQRPAANQHHSSPKRRRCCWIICGVSVGLILLALFASLIYWKFFYIPPHGYGYPPPAPAAADYDGGDYSVCDPVRC